MTEATKPSLGLMPLAPFDPLSDPTSLGQRWKTWKRRFEVYVTALDIQNAKQKRATTSDSLPHAERGGRGA